MQSQQKTTFKNNYLLHIQKNALILNALDKSPHEIYSNHNKKKALLNPLMITSISNTSIGKNGNTNNFKLVVDKIHQQFESTYDLQHETSYSPENISTIKNKSPSAIKIINGYQQQKKNQVLKDIQKRFANLLHLKKQNYSFIGFTNQKDSNGSFDLNDSKKNNDSQVSNRVLESRLRISDDSRSVNSKGTDDEQDLEKLINRLKKQNKKLETRLEHKQQNSKRNKNAKQRKDSFKESTGSFKGSSGVTNLNMSIKVDVKMKNLREQEPLVQSIKNHEVKQINTAINATMINSLDQTNIYQNITSRDKLSNNVNNINNQNYSMFINKMHLSPPQQIISHRQIQKPQKIDIHSYQNWKINNMRRRKRKDEILRDIYHEYVDKNSTQQENGKLEEIQTLKNLEISHPQYNQSTKNYQNFEVGANSIQHRQLLPGQFTNSKGKKQCNFAQIRGFTQKYS
ncbi:UNKNOWN [Stylonychia lemnae]|uniref:Uncharacterized protein n=1 Tax=Stylonychia lemnae TaxID=5949 RepID=A0A078B4G2_STYLE|nr:UNKNOWN [Stylonychia lemnae]|eukprot:CDW88107.1 UNKNOWN [Stylonychia lemnae]